jgi:catechol-2,3-dioxygenase
VSVGLPAWVNHVAFDATDLDDLAARRTRWQEHGITVAEIDHGFCTSIYATDPNGVLVEFCCTTRPFSAAETAEAARQLAAAVPDLEAPPDAILHHPIGASVT